MPIYTRTGDKGKTSLFDGSRVLKSDIRVETYGTVDELNSVVGLALVEVLSIKVKAASIRSITKELEQIQNDLLDIGSALATRAAIPVIGLENRPKDFEKLIDELTVQMPELKNFILPGGGKAGVSLHIARTVTRRAERRVIALMQQEEVDAAILIYLNRLSDLFFTMARYVNFVEKEKEITWVKR